MTDAATTNTNIVDPRLVGAAIVVAIMSFLAVLALLAWSPDLGNKNRAGAHPYSKSAIGYNGLVTLLEAAGRPVSISQVERSVSDRESGLLILTPGNYRQQIDDEIYIAPPALVILPKWTGRTDPARTDWQRDTDLKSTNNVLLTLNRFDDFADIVRNEPPAGIDTPFGQFSAVFDDNLQLIDSENLEPIISLESGDLLVWDPLSEIYILSDPDLANTFGLARPDNARLMLEILDEISGGEDVPIIFDATLHGFERSNNLLRLAFDIPFIGATLAALMTFALIGWAAAIRFGAPVRDTRAFALGKQALADNTAGLITMTRREAQMAPGYLALIRRAAVRELGVPKGISDAELHALFDRMTDHGEDDQTWSNLAADLSAPARSRDDLMEKAQRLFRWRKETTHGIE